MDTHSPGKSSSSKRKYVRETYLEKIRAFRANRIAMLATVQLSLGGAVTNAAPPNHDQPNNPRTPIKHVIVIVGENRSFDHIFATYKPSPVSTLIICSPSTSSTKMALPVQSSGWPLSIPPTSPAPPNFSEPRQQDRLQHPACSA